MILPPVGKADDPRLRDPIDAVKAALDGTKRPSQPPISASSGMNPPPKTPPPPPPRTGGGSGGKSGGPQLPKFKWNWKLFRRLCYAGAVMLLVLPIVTFGMAYLIVDIPKPGDIRTNQVSTILASDGTELAKFVPPEGNRVDVNIDQIPVHVRNAVMAAEDRDFYTNPGFSFSGFARAFKNNIFGGDLQGGSTITQQYVKNVFVESATTPEEAAAARARTLSRKLKEARYALALVQAEAQRRGLPVPDAGEPRP